MTVDSGRLDAELQKAMEESLRLYADGDERFFDYLTDDVRVYALDSVEPSVGRESFRSAFAPTIARRLVLPQATTRRPAP